MHSSSHLVTPHCVFGIVCRDRFVSERLYKGIKILIAADLLCLGPPLHAAAALYFLVWSVGTKSLCVTVFQSQLSKE